MVLPSSLEFPGRGRPRPRGGGENTIALHRGAPYRPISASLAIAPTVSVIIPARNEAANLPYVFGTLPPWIDEILLVDGHSVDDTVAVARALCPTAKVVTQPGRGKGDALQAGFDAATGDILVTIDADGSTDGTEIIRFVSALVSGADYAKGSRFSSSGGSDDITGVRRYGNRLLGVLVNWMFGTHFTDLCYGYNAFWARHLDAIDVSSCPGFEVETLMNIRAAKAGLRIHEVPSHESPRIFGASNLHAIRDGWRILRLILRERLGGARRRDQARTVTLRPTGASATVPAGSYRMPGLNPEPSVHDRDIVAAVTEGDRTGIAAAFGRYGQRLYSYCQSQLGEPADAADAVRDTFVVAAAEAARLSQPDRLRAWLFALARNECQRRLRAAGSSGRLYEAAHAMDDTGTFAIASAQAQSRAQIRAALVGLDPVDREISELHLRHGFYGTDLADILGVLPGQAGKLAERSRSRFERSLGVLTLARSQREHCRELAAILDEHDGKASLSLRWQVRRHIGRCEVCGVRKRGGLNPAILLGQASAGQPPADLRHQTLSLVADRSPAAAAHMLRVLDGAPGFRVGGFPEQLTALAPPGRRLTLVAAAAAAVAALAVLGGAMYYAAAGHAAVSATGGRPPPAGPTGAGTATRASAGVPPAVVRAPSAVPGLAPPVPEAGVPAQSRMLKMAGRGVIRMPGSGVPESGPGSSGPGSSGPGKSPSNSPSAARSPSPARSSVPPSSVPPSPAPSSAPPTSRPGSVPPPSPASAAPSATAPGTTTS